MLKSGHSLGTNFKNPFSKCWMHATKCLISKRRYQCNTRFAYEQLFMLFQIMQIACIQDLENGFLKFGPKEWPDFSNYFLHYFNFKLRSLNSLINLKSFEYHFKVVPSIFLKVIFNHLQEEQNLGCNLFLLLWCCQFIAKEIF